MVEKKMKVIVFDTETTGLPTERNASITQPWKWPHIVQISFILYDTETRKMLSCQDHIIKIKDDVKISKRSQEIHGITPSRCKRRGIDIKLAIEYFNEQLREADVVVAHNISFDKRMIMVESTIPNGTHDSMADVLICLRCYANCEHEHDITRDSCKAIKNIYNLYRI
jgi:DNA polymerase III epsilon subunit-like protein